MDDDSPPQQEGRFLSYGLVVEPPPDDEPLPRSNGLSHLPLVPSPVMIEQAFAEMVAEQPAERSKTLVVLDCANIGWHYGGGHFSTFGLILALQQLARAEVEIKAFLPANYVHVRPNASYRALTSLEDRLQLESLVKEHVISLVPAVDSDDAYILNFARENNGFVISNDLYRDHIASLPVASVQLSMHVWLQENRCGYTFAGQQFVLNPCSALTFALQKHSLLRDLQSEAAGSQHLSAVHRLLHAESTLPQLPVLSLQTLEQLARLYAHSNRPQLFEHVVLMRCHLLLESGRVASAMEEAQLVLALVNPACVEAHEILQQCKAMQS